jgi:phospholipid-translocating ATPase
MSSFFKRNHHPHPDDIPDDEDDTIDPELRLRTVRTAASAIAESIQSERRAQRRKTLRQKGSSFFRKADKKKQPPSQSPSVISAVSKAQTARRNIYVNSPLNSTEVDSHGEPLARYVRNKVRTSSTSLVHISFSPPHPSYAEYTVITFVPKNLYEQFRRYVTTYLTHSHLLIFPHSVANLYFLGLVILQGLLPLPSCHACTSDA